MTALIVACLWFGCPDPPPEPLPTVSKPAVATTVDRTYRGMGSDTEQWRGLVSQYFTDVDKALCVIEHESGGNPDAYNPSSASGLFQVKQFWFDHFGGDAFDPTNNVRIAALVFAEQGWTAWSVVNRGLC